MPDLRNALFKAGLVSGRKFREAEAQQQLDAEESIKPLLKSQKERERRIEILRETTSPDLFRREARKLLLQDPSLVQEILNFAHERGMQGKKNKGGRRLIANLYQVRSHLSVAKSDDEKIKIVDREFPKK